MSLRARLAGLFAANGIYWLAVLSVLLGVGYCSAAAFLFLSVQIGAAGAALVTGLVILTLVLVPLLILSLRYKRSRPAKPPGSPLQGMLEALLNGENVEEMIKGHTKTAVLAALAAGVLTGASPEARQGLMRLFEEFTDKD